MFFEHLANRRFPVTWWLREEHEFDYIVEPDVFHDFFGHVPMLFDPVFADYMQAYGRGGLKAEALGALPWLARLYWYTVEFGLIRTGEGLRSYGAGILSSPSEIDYAVHSPKPRRVGFDLRRIMRSRYRIDAFQETYFVIDGFEQLFAATAPDFAPLYRELAALPELPRTPRCPGTGSSPERPRGRRAQSESPERLLRLVGRDHHAVPRSDVGVADVHARAREPAEHLRCSFRAVLDPHDDHLVLSARREAGRLERVAGRARVGREHVQRAFDLGEALEVEPARRDRLGRAREHARTVLAQSDQRSVQEGTHAGYLAKKSCSARRADMLPPWRPSV